MADISEYIEQIQSAVYGEEVRGAISDSLGAINLEVNKEAFSVTLDADDWEEDSDGYIVYIVENEKVFANSTILISMQTDPTGINLEAAAEYANIYHATVHDGYIKFYSLTEPVEDVPINYLLLSSNSGKVFFAGSGVGGGGGANLTLRGISIVSQPTKLNYKRGETINTMGMQVRARYNNGSVADVTSQCTLSTSTAQSTAGQQTITVTYTEDGVTATTALYITVYQLSSIAVTTQPTTRNYRKGATIDTTGMVVTATYTDNHTEVVTEECTLSTDTAASAAGTQGITVSYVEDGITATTTLNVIVYELLSIALSQQPTTKAYNSGDSISTTGMKVIAAYTDSHTAEVTASCTISPSTAPNTSGDNSVTVSYTEDSVTKTTAFNIEVYELNATISVTTDPGITLTARGTTTGRTYTKNVDSSGVCQITVHYADTYSITGSDGSATSEAVSVTVSAGTSQYTATIEMPFTWAKVKRDVNNGNLSGYSVGDTYEVEVQGDATYEFVLVAKNHDLNNQLIFGLKANGLNTKRAYHSIYQYKVDEFSDSTDPKMSFGNADISRWLNEGFFYLLPEELQNVISERSFEVSSGFPGTLRSITKRVWLPRLYEVTGSGGPEVEQNALRINQFEYYRTPPSYIGYGNGYEVATASTKESTITGSGNYKGYQFLYYFFTNSNNNAYVSNSKSATSVSYILPHFQIIAD